MSVARDDSVNGVVPATAGPAPSGGVGATAVPTAYSRLMASPVSVLVFPSGTEIGLEVARSLTGAKGVDLIGASSVSDHADFVYPVQFNSLPFIDDPQFIPAFCQFVKESRADVLYPAHDDVLLTLMRHQASLPCDIICPPLETCELVQFKRATYKRFEGQLRVPRVFDSLSECAPEDFPIFLKPDRGQGSKGTHLARNRSEAEHYLDRDPTLLLLEHLPGEEFTVDCFTDFNGDLLFCGPRTRDRVINGISVRSRSVADKAFETMAHVINDDVHMNGAWFFQVKRAANGDLALLEIAPRIAGTSGVCRALGVNLPLLSLYNHLGIPVSIHPGAFDVVLDRAWENRFRLSIAYRHVYVDFDDCLCIDGRVNVLLIRFLYQCLNEGIGIHLLSKCASDLEMLLSEYRLLQLFDSITQIGKLDKKSAHIKHRDSILIDDSYAERRDVELMLGIPTFSVDAVECLLA